MISSIFIPLLIGACGVLQNTLNKKMGDNLGIPLALVINNFVVLFLGLMVFAIAKMIPEASLPDLFRQKAGIEITWRYIVPGIFGFLIISLAPLSIEKIGATRLFIGIIVAQIVVSILWDFYAENIPISVSRIVGATAALAGAIIASR